MPSPATRGSCPRRRGAATPCSCSGRSTTCRSAPTGCGRSRRPGAHRNPDRHPDWFTTAYFHRPQELGAELREAGFGDVRVLAVEGAAWLLGDLGAWLGDEARRALLLEHLARLEAEPSLLGASAHLLGLGQCPSSG